MATEDKNKRVVQIEIDDQVKKLTVEGIDKDAQVVMRQEFSDDELDNVAGGRNSYGNDPEADIPSHSKKLRCRRDLRIP